MTGYLTNREHHHGSNPGKDIATPGIPRGLRSLPIATTGDNGPNRTEIQSEAASVDRWWSDDRWKHTKRVYKGTNLCIYIIFETYTIDSGLTLQLDLVS